MPTNNNHIILSSIVCNQLYNKWKIMEVNEIGFGIYNKMHYIYIYVNGECQWRYTCFTRKEHKACLKLLKGLYPHIRPEKII